MKQVSITMRYGAAHNTISVDGVVFDRSQLTRDELATIRRVTVEALTKLWGRGRPARRHRPRRGPRRSGGAA